MPATLDGHVGIGAGGRKVNVVVKFFTPNTATVVMTACSPTDANGDFTIYGITPGTYDVGVKAGETLSLLSEDEVFTEGETTEIDFGTFKRADVTGDDACDMADYVLVGTYYGHYGACRYIGYSGDWLIPECPSPPLPGGACYGYVIT